MSAYRLTQPFCACGRIIGECDGSRRRCGKGSASQPLPATKTLICGWPACKRPADRCYVLRTADGKPYQFHPLCRRCDKWARVWVEQTAKTLGELMKIGPLSMTEEPISTALTEQAFSVGRIV